MTIRFSHLTTALVVALATQTARADLIIEEIVDATLSGGLPKWVEIKNTGVDCVFLGDYEICNYNNGATTPTGCTALTGLFLDGGASYVFGYEFASNTSCSTAVTCFEFVYGTPANQYGGPFINGDDVVALRLEATSAITDVYGLIGQDGSGTAWEYLDSWARRNSTITTASATFSTAEWTYGGANALDGMTAAQIAAVTFPGTFTECTTPFINYCSSGTSQNGCNATISVSGYASASASGGFVLMSAGSEGGKNGGFFFGISGTQNTPWGFSGSRMCVAPVRFRTGLLVASGTVGLCDESYSLDLNALWCSTCPKPLKNPGPSVVCNAQLWYRDPFNPLAPGTSLSNAVEFTTSP